MSSMNFIIIRADELVRKYKTRDPYELCKELGVRIRLKDLGKDIKAYYFYHSRIRNIVLSTHVSEVIRRVLIAHELGHDQLHKEIAMQKGFHEVEMFDRAIPTEYEANIFACEILIDDDEVLKLLNDREKSFFDVARELNIPAPMLDFKFRVLKNKGYQIEPFYIANNDFLKNEINF